MLMWSDCWESPLHLGNTITWITITSLLHTQTDWWWIFSAAHGFIETCCRIQTSCFWNWCDGKSIFVVIVTVRLRKKNGATAWEDPLYISYWVKWRFTTISSGTHSACCHQYFNISEVSGCLCHGYRRRGIQLLLFISTELYLPAHMTSSLTQVCETVCENKIIQHWVWRSKMSIY